MWMFLGRKEGVRYNCNAIGAEDTAQSSVLYLNYDGPQGDFELLVTCVVSA